MYVKQTINQLNASDSIINYDCMKYCSKADTTYFQGEMEIDATFSFVDTFFIDSLRIKHYSEYIIKDRGHNSLLIEKITSII